jgi:hypothetical protein
MNEVSTPIKCGKAHGYHASIKDVRACYNGEEVDLIDVGKTPSGADSATSKQVKYATDLLSDALSFQGTHVTTSKPLEAYGRREISELIAMLNGKKGGRISAETMTNFGLRFVTDGESLAPGKPRDYTDPKAREGYVKVPGLDVWVPESGQTDVGRFDPEMLEDGFYVLNGVVYKVIVAVHASGRKYAKVLDVDGSWDRAPGAIRRLRPEHKMTLVQALEVAKRYATDMSSELYGRCFVCGRTLTDEDSIAANIGPVCAGKFA